MSRASDKSATFSKIRAMNSANMQGKMPKQLNSLPSINNKTEPIPYLLDMLKVVAGSEALKMLVGGLLTKVVGSAEPKVKSVIKKQFTQSNSSNSLPASFKTNGVNIPMKTLDPQKKLQVSPTSTNTGGKILYGSPSNNNFDYRVRDSLRLSGQPVQTNNMQIMHNAGIDSLNIKPAISSSSLNVGTYFSQFVDNSQLINTNEIVGSTMDRIFGTMSKSQNKSAEQILDELQTEKMLEQVINGDDSFVISPEDNAALQKQALETAQGVLNYDMGCGIMPSSLSMNALNTMINTISGSTDPNAVSNAIEDALDASLSGNTDVSAENKQTIKDGFFTKLINTLTVKLLAAVTTAPQIRALMGIMSSIQNNGLMLLTSVKDDIKKWKIYIKCLAKEILTMVAEFIFALVVAYLIKLIKPIVVKIVKEKVNQFVRIIKSLVSAKAAALSSAVAGSADTSAGPPT